MPTVKTVKRGKNHSYHLQDGGEKITGVTTASKDGLPKPQLMAWRSRVVAEYAIDNWDTLSELPPMERYKTLMKAPNLAMSTAGVKGTAVHTLADLLTRGEQIAVPDGLSGYVDSCVAFLDEFDFQPWYTEVVVHSAEERGHAGRLDTIGTLLLPNLPEYDQYGRDDDGRVPAIVDWKTAASGVFGDVAYQLAGYRHSLWLITPDGEEIPMPPVELTLAVHLTPTGYTPVPLDSDADVYRDFLFLKESARIVDESKLLKGDPLIPPRATRYELRKVDR